MEIPLHYYYYDYDYDYYYYCYCYYYVSRDASRTRSCLDLSLCLLNRTSRNHHNVYCKSIAETVHCKLHNSIDFLTSFAGALLSRKTLKVGRSC